MLLTFNLMYFTRKYFPLNKSFSGNIVRELGLLWLLECDWTKTKLSKLWDTLLRHNLLF